MISEQEIQLLKNESPIAEKLGRLTQKQLKLIYENRWFHLLVPKSMGGQEMALPDFAEFMEELASVDGSFAWLVNLGAGANMFSGYMEQEITKNIFSSEKTCVAGSGSVGGTATREKNGYIIDGYWNYASGSAHANFFSLNAKIVGEESFVQSFLVPAGKVEILNTWNVFGLKATASCDFRVNNVWVPENFCFNLQKPSPWANSALYSFPFNTLAEINMLVMLTGLGLQFRKLCIEIVKHKNFFGTESKAQDKISDHRIFKSVLGEADKNFNSQRIEVFKKLHDLWKKIEAKEVIPEAEKEEFTSFVILSANATRNLVDRLYPFLGMNVVFETSEISRVYRDFKMASQHALLSPLRLPLL